MSAAVEGIVANVLRAGAMVPPVGWPRVDPVAKPAPTSTPTQPPQPPVQRLVPPAPPKPPKPAQADAHHGTLLLGVGIGVAIAVAVFFFSERSS